MDTRRPGIVTLRVRDLERSLRFYRDELGLPLKLRTAEAAELQTESFLLALVQHPGAVSPTDSPAIGWEVSSLSDELSRLEAKGISVLPLEDLGPAGRRRGFRDPDGHLLELIEFS